MTWNTDTPRGLTEATAYINSRRFSVHRLTQRSMRAGHIINSTTDEAAATAYRDIDAVCDCLDQVDMNLDLKDKTNIHQALRVLFACEQYYFPENYKARAETLFDKFEAMHWCGVAANDADASNASAPSEPQILMPPRDHPIWGDNGIMAGLAYRKLPSGKLVHCCNTWFSSLRQGVRRQRYHRGAMQGIHYPSAKEPAYSVIISGLEYLEVKDDRWDVVFYCGTGSHENKDPEKIIKASGTKALEAYIASGRPVRVLRTSKARSSIPACGVRYDGLYVVNGSFVRYNTHRGRYLAFELRRRPNQRSRDECLHIPNVHQQTQFKKIEEGYQYQGRFYGGPTWEK
ncbi:hypothetical protein CKM354_001299300 [Cercospora kikuchii]|uniref:YDG domain-containing protein n=1 Tax=Cercospora kikuchii TaxID=84275 RepID=A0A9P3L2J4_9PEZI|nr:uncharacterized protein CKM354_001299300 [Cercospora kikuchii]GIZ49978.1 hypothetical protein CKM354_001299300 [Cercospora kikuchii]